MSLPDTIFIFALALVIFGPKKLPEIGRQLGKLVLEFRRASNEFKMQIEEELRTAEEADRQKKIAAQNAAAAEATAATPSSEESLTIRPPSSGTTESAEAPFKPYSDSEQPEASQTDGAMAEWNPPETAHDGAAEGPENTGQVSTEQDKAPQVEQSSLIVSEYEGALGEYEKPAGEIERTVNGHEGVEEQTTHHHG